MTIAGNMPWAWIRARLEAGGVGKGDHEVLMRSGAGGMLKAGSLGRGEEEMRLGTARGRMDRCWCAVMCRKFNPKIPAAPQGEVYTQCEEPLLRRRPWWWMASSLLCEPRCLLSNDSLGVHQIRKVQDNEDRVQGL